VFRFGYTLIFAELTDMDYPGFPSRYHLLFAQFYFGALKCPDAAAD